MWCITKMVNVYKFHKQLAVTLWTLFKQVKINPPKTGVREPAPGCSYPRWPLSRISSSHDVQKHWVIILGYSQHDGWGRPCAPSVASAAISQKENAAPVHSLHSFLMEMTAPCTHTHTHTDNVWWEQVKTVFHKEEGWPVRMLLYIAGRDY